MVDGGWPTVPPPICPADCLNKGAKLLVFGTFLQQSVPLGFQGGLGVNRKIGHADSPTCQRILGQQLLVIGHLPSQC